MSENATEGSRLSAKKQRAEDTGKYDGPELVVIAPCVKRAPRTSTLKQAIYTRFFGRTDTK
jgi:hypothetical protein